MARINDGGWAFPRPAVQGVRSYEDNEPAEPGMTLRDYFAASAMQSIFTGTGAEMVAARDERYDETNWAQIVALNAYEMADAMIAQRGKQPDGE
jgi:hypothetical protein